VKNHLLDIYVGSEEGPANLELSRDLIRRFADDGDLEDIVFSGSLDSEQAANQLHEEFEARCDEEGLSLSSVGDESLGALRDTVTDDERMTTILENQHEQSKAFIENLE
jgi:CRISPR-associated protein Csc2